MIILIANTQNPKGRTLIQDGRNLHVMSECCYDSISRVNIGMYYEDRCDKCAELLQVNHDGWESFVLGMNDGAGNKAKGGGGLWAKWALHWFGLEDFEIEVNE